MADFGARRILAKEVVAFPVRRRADGPGHETAAAVRADVVQHGVHARGAKRAFVGADPRFQRGRGQRLVALLARGPKLEHSSSTSMPGVRFAGTPPGPASRTW